MDVAAMRVAASASEWFEVGRGLRSAPGGERSPRPYRAGGGRAQRRAGCALGPVSRAATDYSMVIPSDESTSSSIATSPPLPARVGPVYFSGITLWRFHFRTAAPVSSLSVMVTSRFAL